MSEQNYVQELRKDIKVIKKDLRAISIKTRNMARVLGSDNKTTQKTQANKKEKVSWLKTILKKFMTWIR